MSYNLSWKSKTNVFCLAIVSLNAPHNGPALCTQNQLSSDLVFNPHTTVLVVHSATVDKRKRYPEKLESGPTCASRFFHFYHLIHHLSRLFSGLQETLQHPQVLRCWFSISISSIGERETYTTSRDHQTMALTSVLTPPSSTRLTNCDPGLALLTWQRFKWTN